MTDSVPPRSTDRPSSTFVSLGDHVRRAAGEAGVTLGYHDGVWTATDATTGERASGVSMAGAWASRRGVDAYAVHGWLDARGATLVRPPAFPARE